MKNFIILIAVASLAACTSADQKTPAKPLTEDEKLAAARDSANFTSIQWLDSTYQDLGKVKDGRVVEITYRFKNTGNKNLVIAQVSAQCGCTVPEKPEQPIPPGGEDVIKAKFDSRNRKGENHKDVYVRANTNPQDMTLSFRVEVTD
jgi:hypothetical protein